MANQTVTSDLTLAQVIANGLLDGDNITINSGAVVTATAAPSVLIGQINLNDGELLLDGAAATNPIVFVGEEVDEINVNGAGTLRSTLGWWNFPTTGDGTANQTFDASTYFSSGSAIIDNDVFSGVWVETGRRINYDGGSGIAPVVGDWIFQTADNDIHGRITEVSGDGVTGFVVVQFLTGALADNDAIELHTIQSKRGPDYQKSWNALANGVDVREAGTFQEFGNARQNATNFLPSMGSGIAGFGFQQPFASNTLTFGDGTNGFIVPNGAVVRVPMVHFATGTIASIALNNSVLSTNQANRYEMETALAGDVFLNGVSFGSAQFEDSLVNEFQATYCAANLSFGGFAALQRTLYDHCIFVADPENDFRSTASAIPALVDLVNGADIRDCLSLSMNDPSESTNLGNQTSIGLKYDRNIHIGNGTAAEMELIRVDQIEINDLVVIGTQLVFTTSTNVTINLLKTQRNIDGTVAGGGDQIAFQNNCADCKVTGWEVLQGSVPADSKVVIVDGFRIQVRGFHFFDDPFDNEGLGGTQGQEFISIGGLSTDILTARCYTDRGSPNEFALQVSGTTKNFTVQNCAGENTAEADPDGINTSYRGLFGASGSMGGGTGVETDYVGTLGSNFGDIFRSATTGAVYCTQCPGSTENQITILAGSPQFTKDGDVDVVLGDQWELEMPYFMLGHTAFTGVITTSRGAGTVADGTNEWTGVDIAFQYDLNDGSGFNGVYLDLRTAINLTGIAGMVNGIKLKLRFTGTATQTNGNGLLIHTATTVSDQQANLHTIDQVPIQVTAVDASTTLNITGARVYLEAAAGGPIAEGTEIMNQLTDSLGVALDADSFIFTADQPVVGRVRRGSSPTFYKTTPLVGTITSIGLSLTAFMIVDE